VDGSREQLHAEYRITNPTRAQMNLRFAPLVNAKPYFMRTREFHDTEAGMMRQPIRAV
jgi:hypothetical protein